MEPIASSSLHCQWRWGYPRVQLDTIPELHTMAPIHLAKRKCSQVVSIERTAVERHYTFRELGVSDHNDLVGRVVLAAAGSWRVLSVGLLLTLSPAAAMPLAPRHDPTLELQWWS